MHIPCHAAEGSHAFPLASGGDNHRLLIGIVFQLFNINQCIFRNIDAAQTGGSLHNIDHAAAFHHNFSTEFVGSVDDLLHTIHVGCKGCNDHAGILMLLEQGIKGFTHGPLRLGKAGTFCIGGVAHQRQNPFSADFRKALQIDGIAKYRGVVHLKVAGVDDGSCRGIDRQCCRIHNTVVGFNEFHAELSQIDGLAKLHHFPLGAPHEIMLFQFIFNDSHSQACGINGHI